MRTIDGYLTAMDLSLCENAEPPARTLAHQIYLTGMSNGVYLATQAISESMHDGELNTHEFTEKMQSLINQFNSVAGRFNVKR